MDDLSKIEWHDVQDKAARIDDVEFLSGDLTGTDLSGIEWQDAKPVTQSVLDVRDKKTYNVPVAMDGVDATFAIDTQHNGKDKKSFFGKVWYTMDLVADAMEETIQSAERGSVGFAGQLADTALFYAYDVKGLREKIEKLENYDASKYEKVLEKDNAYYHNLSEKQRLEKLERAKNMLNFVTNLREKVGNKISAAQNVLRPQEKMDKIDEYAEALGSGVTSVGASIASLLATKNPEFSAGLMALTFGGMRNKEVFEKAIEQGYDYDVADFYGDVAGTIEGGIEVALEPVFYAVGNLTPVKKLTNELIAGSVSKLASKGSKGAAKKIVSRHTQGVLPAALKSFAVEGSEEGLQESLGMGFENLVGLEDYSGGDILSQTLVSMTVGGLTGSGAAVVGTTSYNAKVEEDNARIVRAVQKEYPDMTPEETQQTADALQEMFYQEENKFVGEFQKLLEKEAEPDALPEGLTKEQVTRETREILKEKYQMTDEQIDKTIDFALLSIDLRNQFNEAYTHFREGLEKAGRRSDFADGEARILAARALAIAKQTKTNVKDVMDRWALKFEESQGAKKQRQAAEKILGDKKDIASMAFKLINRKKGVKDERLSLAAFIKKHGGLKDVGGDLKNMDAQKQYVGLINNQEGMSLDDMAQLTWENGYFKTTERPDVNQLLEAIDSDLRGNKIYADEKSTEQIEDEALETWQQAFDEAGVDLKNDNINTIYRKMKAYENEREIKKLEVRLMFDEKNQERIAMLEENGLTHREALEQLEKERLLKESLDDEIPLFQGQIAYDGALSIDTKEETKGLSEEEFKKKMIDTLWKMKGKKIYNKSLDGDIEIRTSSIKKYKSFFADPNKRLIVPYIPELLEKATFKKEDSYTPETEPNIKAYWKSDIPIRIDNNSFDVHLTVREDNHGNFFWDAQVKESSQHATPATNPGDTGALTSETSKDTLNITPSEANVNSQKSGMLYQGGYTPDLFSFDNKAQANTKPVPLTVKKEVNDLFAWAEKENATQEDLPVFSHPEEHQKIEKTYKQSDDSIEDAGDSLLGNLKRNKKVYTWEELESMNDLMRQRYLSKQYIYPAPTFDELKTQGLSDRGTGLVLYVYSKINSKPAKGYDSIEDQKLYYDFVNRAMAAVIDFAKNNEALIDAWDRYNLHSEILNAVFPPEPGQRGSVFRTNKTFNREALVAGGNRLVRGLQLSGSDLEAIDKIAKLAGKKEEASDEQSKEKKQVWEKYFKVCKNWDGTYFIGDKKGRVYSRDLSFKTAEEATAFAEKLYEKILPYLNTGGDVVSFAGMREGAQRRENNENVDPQGLMDTFGFRGINFGNWTKQSERQEFLNNTYDSLVDLAELLNLPLRALSLEGKLGLAFGAQGVGKAAGHFIPAYNEINLTRKQGAGTLAHEWWHALDYYFGNLSQGKDFSGKAILEIDKDENLRSELFGAFQNLKDKIKNKSLTEEELTRRQKLYEEEQERKIAWRAKTIKAIFARASYAEEIASLVDEIVAKGKNFDYADNEKYRVKFENLIEKKRQTLDNFAHIVGLLHDMDCYAKIDEISHHWKRSTEYYENAKKLNRIAKGMGVGYWTEETELGARAFSSYILEQIRKQSLKNDFLVRNEEKYDRHLDENALAEEFMKRETQENKEPIKIVDFLVPAYPSNVDERTSIFNAFDHLFDVMNVDEANNYKLYQGGNNPRGAYKDSIIYLFENNDASTVIHELGHFFLDDMQKFADDPETSAQLDAVYNYLGSKDGNLTREQHELFADSFEVYLLDGRSPNTLLAKVFARFRRWIGAIFSEVKRLNKIKISDDIKTVFDNMLGGRSLDFAMQTNAAQMTENLQNGQIQPAVINKALDLLTKGKMSRADMEEMLDKIKTGELQRKDVAAYLKKFEESNVTHHEQFNPFDKMKYKSALQKGNFSKKEVKEKIERLLKWSEPKMQGGKLVGKFPNLQLNRYFDHVHDLYNTEKYQAREKIADNIKLINAIIKGEEIGDQTQLAFDNKILSIAAGRADASLLLEVYSALSDSYNLGRISAAITGAAKKMRKERLIMDAYDVLTDSARVDERKEKMKLIQGLNRLGLSMVSWQGLLDILSMNDKTSKTGESMLSKEMDVFDVEQKEAQGIADDGEHISRLIEKKLKSNNNSAISLQRYVNTKLKEKFTLEWGDNKKTFTKDQLLDIYMKSFDEETRKMMMEDSVAQYNLEFLQQVKELIDEDDAAVVDALFEFYDENYQKINAFYEDKYGTSLGKRAFYSPRSMDRGGINVDTGDASSYAGFAGVKQRTAKAGAIKPKGAFDVLQNYIVNSNHWIAWADKLIDINAVFGDVRIKNIIRNLWGTQMEKRIAYEVSRMASNDKFQSKFGYSNLFNKIRANYATSALALKPALAIKQLTSFPAYWEKMSTSEFLAGIADFITHPKQAIETLGTTTLMKTRGVNIIKDFEQLSKAELIKNKANKIKLRELMMFNIKFGDRGAIYMGGWALYKAELNKNLKAGLSEDTAKLKALQTFEKVTDETQQSGRLSEQSYWQSNPFLRAFTMFQSSQNQYLRKEISAIRGLMTGRMDKGKVLKTLFIYHVLLPCFFQAVADGFRWDKDAQLRAALLGSLNGVFILNSVLEKLYDAYIGGKGLWNSSLRIRDIVPFWGSGEDLIKFFDDLAEGDVELDDYIDVMRAFGKPVGELTGLPVKYPLDVIKNFWDYAEDDEMKKEVLLWLGWSPYALRDLED